LSAKADNCKDCRLSAHCKSFNCRFLIRVRGTHVFITRPCCDCVLHCEAVRKIEGE
jgi:hypothetical protein